MADDDSQPRKRGREGGRPSRSEEIIAAATTAFAAGGYHNTSLADIGRAIGMTPAGILHHFGVKESLLTAVLQRRDAMDVAPEVYEKFPTGAEYLEHLVRTVAVNQERLGITQLYAVLSAESVTHDHPAQAWFRSRYVGLRGLVDDAIRVVLELPDGVMASETATASMAIVATMDGLQVQWLLDPEHLEMPPALRVVIDSVVGALRAQAEETGAVSP